MWLCVPAAGWGWVKAPLAAGFFRTRRVGVGGCRRDAAEALAGFFCMRRLGVGGCRRDAAEALAAEALALALGAIS